VTEVRGFGRQFGQLAAGAGPPRVALLPKIRLDIVALDDDVETLVEAIAKHARTETIGDGKIWITPVDGACASGPASGTAPPSETLSRGAACVSGR
jgi:Nitrogen regulatory protein PII